MPKELPHPFYHTTTLPQEFSPPGNEVTQNVLTYASPLISGMEHKPVQCDSSSYSNPRLSTSLTGANTMIQGDAQDTPDTFALDNPPLPIAGQYQWRSVSHSYPQPSTSLTGANTLIQGGGQGTSATSLPLSTDFDNFPLPGNEAILTHTSLLPSGMQPTFDPYNFSFDAHSQLPPSRAGASALIQEDVQGTPTTSFSMLNNGHTRQCGWVDEIGAICGRLITSANCITHLVTAHGVRKSGSDRLVRCGWCSDQVQQKNIHSHIKQIHLEVERKRVKKAG